MELVYNHIFNRWEVFSEKSVKRNGEIQPVFVGDYPACANYQNKVEG